ncbi:hypothetical protein PG993_012217 [Apiospora rasikravindrae]|uniref:Uncharacterized protein n=1 Tax=Apiospora rasikravindrae TaxID=990691 RepID=A0ABR1S1V2_9PEZI
MGYSGATYAPPRPDRQQPIITGPIQQTSAIPLPRSRSPSPAPSSIMTTSDPPPYPYSEFAGGAYSRPPGGDTERLLRTPAPLPFPVPALHSPGSKH